jgi:hypothetical protein
LPLVVGRQRVVYGVDTFPAIDRIPAEGVGSYQHFRGFAANINTLVGGIATYDGSFHPPAFSPAWKELAATEIVQPPAVSILMPIGQGAMQGVPAPGGGASVGVFGSMIVSTAAPAPRGSVHTQVAIMDFQPQAADLIGIGAPVFATGPAA